MSSALYRLGRLCFRRRKSVLGVWGLILVVAVSLGLGLGRGTDDTFTIPGAESQTALDTLGRVFPEVSGTSAQVVVSFPDGQSVESDHAKQAIARAVSGLEKTDNVIQVMSPFDSQISGAVSKDHTTAVIQVQFDVAQADLSDAVKESVTRQGERLQDSLGDDVTVLAGGDAFSNRVPQLSPTEGIGLVIAIVVLLIFFRSLGASFIPICTAVLGVAITYMTIQAGTGLMSIMAVAPMLSTMIGLAVGIDYALFIVSRHRDQLRDGLEAEESAARATATAGSAVVFAGLTVIIALLGLVVARMPFLTIMGVAAALGVALSVTIALTVIPAILGFAGDRLKPRTRTAHRETGRRHRRGLAERWVGIVTRVPALTIVVVLIIVGVLAAPATNLRLALPGNGSEPVGNAARDTYDLLADKYGPGYNGPLIVTVNLLSSHTPVEDMDGLRKDLLAVDGVDSVALSTPNPSGDTGVAQVIPAGGPDSQETADLVQRLRDKGPALKAKYGFRDYAVTGITAITADVSSQLGAALVPFGLLVVGLSLVLLVMVFRSIIVPIKATLGYVLSVLAALGATTWVFVDGHAANLLGVAQTGYVVSFLPIILMGVLFGLAMDYEVFLVSRTAEVHARTGDPDLAIREGYVKAAPVVTVAALIMLGVFVSFIHQDNAIIKPIAFGLTVGVLVDAFLVRLTLVPAVLKLCGEWAWKMPASWQRRLPRFDVEGEGLTRQLRLADWPAPGSAEVVSADGLGLHDLDGMEILAPLDLHVGPGEFHLLIGPEGSGKSAALYAVAGRVTQFDGDLKTVGKVLPDLAHNVREQCCLVTADSPDPAAQLADSMHRASSLVCVDDLDRISGQRTIDELSDLLARTLSSGGAVIATAASPALARHLIPDGISPVVHELAEPEILAQMHKQEALD